ncbi:MAG: DUF4139 domain-containing protein [Rhodospirillales bacterium]|nr:DUF4139 domain-containing protein [Rhodospirillales bacterium]
MTATMRNRFALAALLGTAVFFGPGIETARAQNSVEDRNAHPIIPLSADARSKLQLTVYPGNLAMIAEQRNIAIPDGQSTLRIGGLPSTIIDDSLLIGSSRESNLVWSSLRKRTNGYNALAALLQDQVGKTVTIRRNDNELIEGTLVALTHIALVKTDAGIEQVPTDQIIISDLPEGFITSPFIDADIATSASLEHVSMAYLLGGIGWGTSYIASYDSDANKLNLSAIARITNHSGSAFDGAQLRLVAGDQNRVGQAPIAKAARGEMMMTMADSVGSAASAPERANFENLHVYGPFDGLSMKDGDTAILPLIDAQSRSVTRHAIFNGASSPYGMDVNGKPDFVRPDLEISLTNDGGKDASSPWPDGIVRIFAKTPNGDTGFLAEDNISLTPVGRDATLRLGKASELSGTREVTAFSRKARPNLPDDVSADLKWTVRNTSSRAETITIRENVPNDWSVTSESHKHQRPQPGLLTWEIKVPAKGEVTLSWSVDSTR